MKWKQGLVDFPELRLARVSLREHEVLFATLKRAYYDMFSLRVTSAVFLPYSEIIEVWNLLLA